LVRIRFAKNRNNPCNALGQPTNACHVSVIDALSWKGVYRTDGYPS